MIKEAKNLPVIYPDKDSIILNRDGTVGLRPNQLPTNAVDKCLTPTSTPSKRN